MRSTVSLSIVAFVLVAPLAIAADGAIPVWEPTSITEPGRYVLTRDVISGFNPVITIAASNVHLDLNGFAVEGDANVFAADVILVNSADNVTIENGTVIGGGAGIRLSSDTRQFRLQKLAIRGGRTGIGTALSSSQGVIRDNLIENISDEGISAIGSVIQVRDNLVQADGTGIKIDRCDSCIVAGNTIKGGPSAGILVTQTNGALVQRNVVSGSGTGIRVTLGGYNQIEGNVVSGCSGYGVRFLSSSFSSVYRGNTARNNAGSGCAGSGSPADLCDEGTGNTSHGDNYVPTQL